MSESYNSLLKRWVPVCPTVPSVLKNTQPYYANAFTYPTVEGQNQQTLLFKVQKKKTARLGYRPPVLSYIYYTMCPPYIPALNGEALRRFW